jgi:hypothetical protein
MSYPNPRWTLLGSVAAAAAFIALFGTGARTSPALACSLSNHCYGVAEWAPTPDLHGGKTIINVACLHNDTTSSKFINAETWIATNGDSSFGSWIEEGMKYGWPLGSLRYWFWADKRPGYPYSQHNRDDLVTNLNTDYTVNINRTSVNQQWAVLRNGNTIGYSVSNPGPGKGLETGVETTEDSSRVDATSADLEWQDTSDTWHFRWEKAGFADPTIIEDSPPNAEWYSTNADLHYTMHTSNCG